jgi:predicted DCC family thiol-disulfide oxidoreductase YuxK
MDAVSDGPSPSGSVILFDGVCNLCNATIQFVIARDREGRFRFAALDSEAARAQLGAVEVPPHLPDSIILLDEDGVFTRSTAALRIARGLTFPWPLLYGFIVVPRVVRDAIYDWIAAHRYRWFGRREACMIPTPDVRSRFLD